MGEPENAPPHWLNSHFAKAGNRLRFDRFMELCLYDEKNGYYAQNITSVGAIGDFSTTPALSSLLADSLSRSIADSDLHDVIEIGPGAGHLAAQILSQLRPSLLSFRKRIRYHLVERSPPLRHTLQKRLRRSARIHPNVKCALEAAGGRAFIISNELVDAFPVRVFRNSSEEVQELFLSLKNGSLTEEWISPGLLPDSTQFETFHDCPQRIEIHESYRSWMEQWLPFFKKGKWVTIDYGGTTSEIHHRRPHGTLRAYYHHDCLTGPDLYRLPGRQDLTADVNFDDLIYWGEKAGLSTIRLVTQHEYCLTHPENVADTPENQFLTDLSGAGSAFKVLEQKRG